MESETFANVEAFIVKPCHQINFKVEVDGYISFVVTDGRAEINGFALKCGKIYKVCGPKYFSVETMSGFNIIVKNKLKCTYEKYYLKEYKIVKSYSATFFSLSHTARISSNEGPCVLVFGPQNTDKTKFCQSVLNTLIQHEQCPTFIDLDVSDNSLGVSGTVSYRNLTSGKPLGFLFNSDLQKSETFYFGSKDKLEFDKHFVEILNYLESYHRRNQFENSEIMAGILVIKARCDSSNQDEIKRILDIIMRFEAKYLMYTGDDSTFKEIKTYSKCESLVNAFKKLPTLTPKDSRSKKTLKSGQLNLYEHKHMLKDFTYCRKIVYDKIEVYRRDGVKEFVKVSLTKKIENKFMCGIKDDEVVSNNGKPIHVLMTVWIKHVDEDKKTIVLQACKHQPVLSNRFFIVDYVS